MTWTALALAFVVGWCACKVNAFFWLFVCHCSERMHAALIERIETSVRRERKSFRYIHGKDAPMSDGRGY